jgi:hypothetical protein
MKKLIPLFLVAALCIALPARASQKHHPNQPPPPNMDEPYLCGKDADCTIVRPPCGAPISINKRNYARVNKSYEIMRPYYKCADWIPIPEAKGVTCLQNRCKALLGEAKPDTSPQAKDAHYCDEDKECQVVLGECCEKNFVNSKNAPKLRRKVEEEKTDAIMCFHPDRRHVKNLRCEKHQCTADLEIPEELMDDSNHSLKDKCEQ